MDKYITVPADLSIEFSGEAEIYGGDMFDIKMVGSLAEAKILHRWLTKYIEWRENEK